MEKKLVFLTRGEISIDTGKSLSIHLKTKDRRVNEILKGITDCNLQFVVVNPKVVNINTAFFRENWYLIRSVRYTSSWEKLGFTHFHFRYTLNQKIHTWQSDGVRMLTCDETYKFKKTLCI